MAAQIHARILCDELEAAVAALATFDVCRLEAMAQKARTMTPDDVANARKLLPELLEKHALLGQMIAITGTNLKVLVSVLNLESTRETRLRWVP
ncbi:MAG: hypothetical protein ABI197_02020 [Granulicella sp.]